MDIQEIMESLQKSFGDFSEKTTQRLDKIESRFQKDIERIETVLARPNTNTRSYNGDGTETRNVEPLQPGEVRHLSPKERLSDITPRTFADGEPIKGHLSFDRYIRGLISGDWRGKELEKRAMSESDPVSGGYLVPSVLSSQIIDRVRAASALGQCGITTIPITEGDSLRFAKITSDPVASWRGEGAVVPTTTALTGEIELRPKVLACILPVSFELMSDCNDQNIFSRLLAEALRVELDRAGIHGSGIGAEPLGICNVSGLNEVSMGDNGAQWPEPAAATSCYAKIMEAIRESMEANVPPTCALLSPRTMIDLETLADMNSQPVNPPKLWGDLRKVVSTQVSNTMTQGNSSAASAIIFGGFQDVYLGVKNSLELVISKTSSTSGGLGFERMQALILAYLRCDYVVARPSSLTILRGILAS